MREVAIIGVGAHATGQFTDKPPKELGYTAIWGALEDAGVMPTDIVAAYVGNSIGGLLTGQEGVRGQVVLQHSGMVVYTSGTTGPPKGAMHDHASLMWGFANAYLEAFPELNQGAHRAVSHLPGRI